MKRLLALTLIAWPLAGLAAPPHDGACADLKGGTPGLFGLCVAFCKAQGLGDAGDIQSNQTAMDLLANYERKRGPDDPDMPCIAEPPDEPPPQVNCSCWSAEDLTAALPAPACEVSGTYHAAGQNTAGTPSVAAIEASATQFERFCQFEDGVSSSPRDPKFELFMDDVDTEGCVALWQWHAKRTHCLEN
jgi:hypothetical protein